MQQTSAEPSRGPALGIASHKQTYEGLDSSLLILLGKLLNHLIEI